MWGLLRFLVCVEALLVERGISMLDVYYLLMLKMSLVFGLGFVGYLCLGLVLWD